jgi:hypothetical protein
MHTHFRQSLEVSCRLAHLLTVEQQVSVAPECAWVHVLLGPHGRVVVQAERKVVLDQVLACRGGGEGEKKIRARTGVGVGGLACCKKGAVVQTECEAILGQVLAWGQQRRWW